MRFLAQQARQPRASLKLRMVPDSNRDDPLWQIPCVLAAASCSNLCLLRLTVPITLNVAVLMLDHLPSSWSCLKLSPHPETVSACGFGRLEHLQELCLVLDIPGVTYHFLAYYVPHSFFLIKLETFWPTSSSAAIDGQGLGFPRLQHLGISGGPFDRSLDLALFPSLESSRC